MSTEPDASGLLPSPHCRGWQGQLPRGTSSLPGRSPVRAPGEKAGTLGRDFSESLAFHSNVAAVLARAEFELFFPKRACPGLHGALATSIEIQLQWQYCHWKKVSFSDVQFYLNSPTWSDELWWPVAPFCRIFPLKGFLCFESLMLPAATSFSCTEVTVADQLHPLGLDLSP